MSGMAAHKLQGRAKFCGLDISIENAKGSVRKWYDPHGKQHGSTKMKWDYGYLCRTKGTDGDHVDVYLGPEMDTASHVYVVYQMKKPSEPTKGPWEKYDEDKCMLGWPSAEAAKAAYLGQYNDPRFFGGMKAMSVENFCKHVTDPKNHGKKVANGDMMQYFQDHPDKLREKKEREAREKKAARIVLELRLAGEKTASISDRIDDVGIGMLAAPSIAQYAGEKLEHAKNPWLKTLGVGAAAAGKKMKDSHLQEIGGLALVAPGVTKSMERGIKKILPKKPESGMVRTAALEKLASDLLPGFEYMTQPQKIAVLDALRRMTPKTSGLASGAANLVRRSATGLRGAVRGGVSAAEHGAVPFGAAGPLRAATPVIKAPIATATGAVRGGVPMQQPAARKSLVSGRTLAKAGVIGAGGLALYGGKKTIDAVSGLTKSPEEPWNTASVYGQNRVF